MSDYLIPPSSNSPHNNLPAPLPAPTAYRRSPAGVMRPAAAAQSRGLTPSFVLRVFTQWWKWVVPLGIVLAGAAGAVVWTFHVPKFESSAIIQIEPDAPFIAFQNGQIGKDPERYVQTQIELLRSPVVLTPVLDSEVIKSIPDIASADDPLKYLQENLSVRPRGKSELFDVIYVASSPTDAATVVSQVVTEYLRLQLKQETSQLGQMMSVLKEEQDDREKRVEVLRERVIELSKKVTGKDPFGQGLIVDTAAFAPLASLYQSLTEAQVDHEILEAEIAAAGKSDAMAAVSAASMGLLDLEVSNRADVRRLADRLNLIREQLTAIKSAARLRIGDTWQDDPNYLQLAEQEKQTATELAELKALVRSELKAARQEQRKTEYESQLAAKIVERNAARARVELLEKRIEAEKAKTEKSSEQSAAFEFARAELEREQKVFELIAARKLALQTEQRAPARVSLRKPAETSHVAIEPIPYKHLLLACSVGLFLPLGLAVGYEALSRRISSSEELTHEAALPVLGELARFPRRHIARHHANALPGSLSREAYVFEESVDSLRTQLMLTEQVGALGSQRVVAVCSAASGEGKSSLATSLTLSLAEASKRPTLLIDADLRSPDIANYLQVPSRPGLCEVVEGKAELESAIQRVGKTSAYVLPAGRLKGNPHHVFEGSRIESLLGTLRESFDTIIIDTPPVLAASDALVYARAADLVLFCSLADTSRATQVRVAVERLRGTGANVAGAVLSGVSVGSYVYRYGTYGHGE